MFKSRPRCGIQLHVHDAQKVRSPNPILDRRSEPSPLDTTPIARTHVTRSIVVGSDCCIAQIDRRWLLHTPLSRRIRCRLIYSFQRRANTRPRTNASIHDHTHPMPSIRTRSRRPHAPPSLHGRLANAGFKYPTTQYNTCTVASINGRPKKRTWARPRTRRRTSTRTWEWAIIQLR